MHLSDLLQSILIAFGSALAAGWCMRALRLPVVMGFIVSGVAVGPSAMGLIDEHSVAELGEIGLILLLFIIGLELSPELLLKAGWRLFAACGGQLGVCVLFAAGIAFAFGGLPPVAMLLLGICIYLSSTAIVLKHLGDRGEINTATGGLTTGILLLQDVIAVLAMLSLSVLSAGGNQSAGRAVLLLGIQVAGLCFAFVAARAVLPRVISSISSKGGHELLTLFAVVMAAAGGWLAHLLGWSPALGACVTGLMLAEADHRHQLAADIAPFRDTFTALFFVSLGMQVDLGETWTRLPLLVAAVGVTLVLKPIVIALPLKILGWPVRISLRTGLGMATISEFSYVLARQAVEAGVISTAAVSFLTAYAVTAMAAGALLLPFADRISMRLGAWLSRAPQKPEDEDASPAAHHANHVIIVGYGFAGETLARMLNSSGIESCAIEMNPARVWQAKEDGISVVAGDAASALILEHAGLMEARALVVGINNRAAADRVVAQAVLMRPNLYVLARTVYSGEIERLYKLGATQVIPQDFEATIEVAAHILKQFGIPDNIIEAQITSMRAGGYAMLRGKATSRAATEELIRVLQTTATQTFFIERESPACDQTIAQTNLRARAGCMIIAVVRNGVPTTNPAPDFLLRSGDVLVMVGAHAQLNAARTILAPPQPEDERG